MVDFNLMKIYRYLTILLTLKLTKRIAKKDEIMNLINLLSGDFR